MGDRMRLLSSVATAGVIVLLLCSRAGFCSETPLEKNLRPENTEEVSNVFRDMGVVQRRAMAKGGRFLLSTSMGLDFSDGPYTSYALNLNPGYAISDFVEIYLSYSPKFLVSPRSIVRTIDALQFPDGSPAQISSARPLYQLGGELVWAPLYGKDSLGISHIVRSDTFFKISAGVIRYDTTNGARYSVGFGKTFFLSNFVGARIAVNAGYLQGVINADKSFRTMAILESGLMFYL
ncbi:MAG: hypothetical protein A2603_05260 [Bdellovibrionales bacterium RIFOXYD1_FULL_55_31]|nr:MAG: hypothetical protein A2603_05260 [Bdellovibrionales bacterium RIFOXYD1_FULL_55_31]